MTGAPVPIDYTAIGYDDMRAAMLRLARDSLPEWSDFSESDLGVLLVELVAYAADVTLYYQTRIAANLLPETSDEPEALVQLLRLIGYELQPPSPATADLRVAIASTESLPVHVPRGTQFTATVPGSDSVVFESVDDLAIGPADLTPADPVTGLRYFGPVSVVEGTTRLHEPVGISDGSPNQAYGLADAPVIRHSVDVLVVEPGGTADWTEVETLARSTAVDRHFVVRRGADGRATIAFGDGENGMIPPRLASGNVGTITATYRVGGGPQGNVARNTDMVPSLGEIQEAVNLEPAAGGAAAESLDRARAFAPRLFRAQERAVTTGDYEDLALQVPGVGKVRAVALNWNEVVLYVAPAGQVAEPSETLVRDLRAYFEHRRLATASVEVVGPDAVDVFLRATVQAQPYFRERDVRVAVEHAVDEVLAFERIGFGQRLYVSRLYEAIQELPQVAGLTIDQFSRTRDGSVDTAGVLQLGPSELPRPGYRDGPGRPPIEIVVQGAATESA
jgi:hypothetical protein